jgi:hypothetical protein
MHKQQQGASFATVKGDSHVKILFPSLSGKARVTQVKSPVQNPGLLFQLFKMNPLQQRALLEAGPAWGQQRLAVPALTTFSNHQHTHSGGARCGSEKLCCTLQAKADGMPVRSSSADPGQLALYKKTLGLRKARR